MRPLSSTSPSNPKQRVAIVLGMHRGGGGELCEALAALGVVPGGDKRSAAADCRAINEQLLGHLRVHRDHLGLEWNVSQPDRRIDALKQRAVRALERGMSAHPSLWSFEDPDTCRLLSFWRPALAACGCRAIYAIALRDPIQVAGDLARQDGIPIDKGYLLWLQHMVAAVVGTSGENRFVVDTDLLRERASGQLWRLVRAFDPDCPSESQPAGHAELPLTGLAPDGLIPRDVITVYGLLSRAARDEISLESPEVLEQFQEIHGRLSACSAAFSFANAMQKERAELAEELASRDREIDRMDQALGERTTRLRSVTAALALRDGHINEFAGAVADMKASLSWRITAPLRAAAEAVHAATRAAVDAVRSISQPRASTASPVTAVLRAGNWEKDYVADTAPPPQFTTDIKTIAFYLPQFHPIPENDEWWGRGFTEWTNVSRAQPQFEGHYQPHLPGELGFYDLRVKDVQKRQVELAKRYGIGAFCFYFYWFGGKRLLELPVHQFLDNADLDLPFCLCWANENWTRQWDGLENESLIAQSHSAEDDIRFLAHVAEYMRDPRYLRVDGRPVLLVYRPALLPDAKATAMRWRAWAKRNGLGELYLIYPQSFEVCDPADYGFDAATEFPPNLSSSSLSKDMVRPFRRNFEGSVYDWRSLLERSRNYYTPPYTLFRAVCPSWDSEPRRPGRGTALLHSTPQGYREWLTNAAADTRKRFHGDERLIFVNAWNEWAEGAHLEPDRRYGYAWLQATRDALASGAREEDTTERRRVVVVTHDAYPHGAQFLALAMARELAGSIGCEVEVVCLGDGPLKERFGQHGKLHDLAGLNPQGAEATELAEDLFKRGFRYAIVNTTVSGLFLGTLKAAGLRTVALVHELRDVMLQYNLERHASTIASDADSVVFPAVEVRDAFQEFAAIGSEKAVVRPQGLFTPNSYANGDRPVARRVLRAKLGIPANAQVVLGLAFADRRKGVDYFVAVACRMVDKDPSLHFVWVGHWEPEMQRHVAGLAEQSPALFRQIHFVGFTEDTAAFYAGADVFALTSREDPFPCVVLEAMDAGLPIVAFAGSGGANALVDEGLGENVPMGDVDAFAAAVGTLLCDAAARERCARTARIILVERFSFRHYLFDLLTLLGMPLHRVSVVVPNYNYEQYLPERIRTILKPDISVIRTDPPG